jgi:small subunit ribosomal protein S17
MTVREGVVEKCSGAKSIRVVLQTLVREPRYGKYQRRKTRLLVHDQAEQAQVGDTVEIAECRPLSRRKSWRLTRVLKKGTGVQVLATGNEVSP